MLADPVNNDISAVDFSPVHEVIRQIHVVDRWPLKIRDFPALPADEVVVAFEHHFKSGLTFDGFHFLNQSMLPECGQRSIHRIERKHGDFPGQAPVQDFRGGMVCGSGQFPINFHTLMSQLETVLSAGGLETIQLLL